MRDYQDEKLVGDKYVAATYLKDGENRDVRITVDTPPEKGQMIAHHYPAP